MKTPTHRSHRNAAPTNCVMHRTILIAAPSGVLRRDVSAANHAYLHWTLLILTFAILQLFARTSAAVPVVTGVVHDTIRFGPHSLPLLPVGDKVQIAAVLNSNEPIGSPTISVQAIQGGITLTLDQLGPGHPLFEGAHVFYKFIDYDGDFTGSWQIIPTDSTGTGPPLFTNAIADPEFLPLVEDITVQGTPLGARVAWTLPNLDGFDVDGIFVRVIEATSGRHVWESNLFPVQTTSFEAPAGVLQVGVDYVYWVGLGDIAGSYFENTSLAFSEPFRFPFTPGDFNNDGHVDRADAAAFARNFGLSGGAMWSDGDFDGNRRVDLSDLSILQSQLEQSFIAPTAAAIPEPPAAALAALALAAFLVPRLRRSRIPARREGSAPRQSLHR